MSIYARPLSPAGLGSPYFAHAAAGAIHSANSFARGLASKYLAEPGAALSEDHEDEKGSLWVGSTRTPCLVQDCSLELAVLLGRRCVDGQPAVSVPANEAEHAWPVSGDP